MKNYCALQDEVRIHHGISRTGAQLIDCWGAFVEECCEGYEWDISEYRNEIRVRRHIETLLRSDALAGHPDHDVFSGAVQVLDDRFRQLGHKEWKFPNGAQWWERQVPTFAGESLAQYCLDAYGYPVEAR